MSHFKSAPVKLTAKVRRGYIAAIRPGLSDRAYARLADQCRFERMKAGPQEGRLGLFWPGEDGFNPLEEVTETTETPPAEDPGEKKPEPTKQTEKKEKKAETPPAEDVLT